MGNVNSPLTAVPVFINNKRSTSPLTTGTLWTYTGGIRIEGVYGIVRTGVQVQATQTKISVKNDNLTAFDLCSNGNISGTTVGTLFHITDNPANSLQQHTTGVDTNENALVEGYSTICSTSGIITVTYSSASTGVIDWYLIWSPLTLDATVS